MLRRLALCSALMLACGVTAQPYSPRAGADGVASAIESNYYDVARGKAIASDLRSASAKGDFDRLSDPRDLAAALSERLASRDRHFVVTWEPQAQVPTTVPPGAADVEAMERRSNYGIRRVEVQPGNIGYLDLRQFSPLEFGQPDQAARRAIDAALQLLSGADAVIIDLRENGGGSPQMVGYLSSAFTARNAPIYNTFHAREGTRSEAPEDWYPAPRLDVPLYLLINGRTASAAEAFAYTLQQAKRAVVLGEASAGAANPGAPVDAGHGLRVFVSFATPVNPISHRNWEGDGIIPDVKVASDLAKEHATRLALQAIVQRAPGPDSTEARWVQEALQARDAGPRIVPRDFVGSYGVVTITDQNGTLWLTQERRPARALRPHGGDLFSIVGDPIRRVQFERDGKNRAVALEIRMPQRPPRRFLR